MTQSISTSDCLEWLDNLDEGATILDTDLRFVSRIKSILEDYSDEVRAANAAYRRWKDSQHQQEIQFTDPEEARVAEHFREPE